MKKHILLLFIAVSLMSTVRSQIFADPSIEQVFFSDLNGQPIDDTMPLGYVARLNVLIKNLNIQNGLPAGSCKIKIGLGSKLILQPGFNISLASTNQYFQWTAQSNGGQVQLTGELINAIPPGYGDTAKFNVQGSVLEYSTITANFLVTNHNTPVVLSDEEPSNNSSFRLYKIVPVLIPVDFRFVTATNDNCQLRVDVGTDNETNVKEYTVEVSTNGRDFSSGAVIKALGLRQYTAKIPIEGAMQSPALFIRIRATDHDGRSRLSNTTLVNGLCGQSGKLRIYPNPLNNGSLLNIRFTEGSSSGSFRITVRDMSGRQVQSGEYALLPSGNLQLDLSGVSAGEYLLLITSLSTGKTETGSVLKF